MKWAWWDKDPKGVKINLLRPISIDEFRPEEHLLVQRRNGKLAGCEACGRSRGGIPNKP